MTVINETARVADTAHRAGIRLALGRASALDMVEVLGGLADTIEILGDVAGLEAALLDETFKKPGAAPRTIGGWTPSVRGKTLTSTRARDTMTSAGQILRGRVHRRVRSGCDRYRKAVQPLREHLDNAPSCPERLVMTELHDAVSVLAGALRHARDMSLDDHLRLLAYLSITFAEVQRLPRLAGRSAARAAADTGNRRLRIAARLTFGEMNVARDMMGTAVRCPDAAGWVIGRIVAHQEAA
jgi:hypothetical protein